MGEVGVSADDELNFGGQGEKRKNACPQSFRATEFIYGEK